MVVLDMLNISKLVQPMLFYGYLILDLQFTGLVKPSSSLLSRIPNQNSIMPDKFLLEPRFEKVQTCETVSGIMPSRCFQDESRCFGSKHVVVF